MELNREQIIKALECCTGTNCKGAICPYRVFDRCMEKLSQDAAALIKQLTEENERLRGVVAKYEDILDKEHEHHQEMIGDLNEILRQIRYIKAEKEHLEKVVEGKLKRLFFA